MLISVSHVDVFTNLTRVRRDITERGRDIKGVLDQYSRFVKPSFDEFIYPTVKYADIIIPRGLDNTPAIDLVTKHISRQLADREQYLRLEQSINPEPSAELSPNIYILPQRPQLRHLHTIIRNRDTNRHDFVFYSERLSRLVIEHGLSGLPYTQVDIPTATGCTYPGLKLSDQVCGISIVRGAASMEACLRTVLKDIPIGKILIQTDLDSNEPVLHYVKLPPDLSNRSVFLTDAQIATGAAAMMAIRIILDHHVPQERIVVLCLIATSVGLGTIMRAFPGVRVVCAAVDDKLDKDYHIIPGMGNFADRYFGTEGN